MVNRVSRPRARKKKQQRQAASDDDDVDWVQFLPALVSGGAALYNAFKKSKPKPFDVSGAQGMEEYGDSIDAYSNRAQEYLDPDSQISRQMTNQVKGDAMDQIGVQNQLNSRNPFTSSGIMQAQNRQNTSSGIGMANKNVAQLLMGLQQQGTNMMGQSVGQRGQYADIFAQQGIANQEQDNQWNSEMGGLMGQFGVGAASGGLEGILKALMEGKK